MARLGGQRAHTNTKPPLCVCRAWHATSPAALHTGLRLEFRQFFQLVLRYLLFFGFVFFISVWFGLVWFGPTKFESLSRERRKG